MKLDGKTQSQRYIHLSSIKGGFPSSHSSIKRIQESQILLSKVHFGHDFKYKGITAYKSVTFRFKLQLKIQCCTKPRFSFHFSIWAALSSIWLEKIHQNAGTSTKELRVVIHLQHLQAAATSAEAEMLLVACLENQKYFPGHCSPSLATFPWELGCSIYSTRAAPCCTAAETTCYSPSYCFSLLPRPHLPFPKGFALSPSKSNPSAFLRCCKWQSQVAPANYPCASGV